MTKPNKTTQTDTAPAGSRVASDKAPPLDPNVAVGAADEEKIDAEEMARKEDENFQARHLGEPIAKEYVEGKYAEVVSAAHKPAETIVEHPLAPTDTNPNPHGQRSQPNVMVSEKDDNGVEHRAAAKEEVEVTGEVREGVHIGDGRVLAYGEKMKISRDQAKVLKANKQVK